MPLNADPLWSVWNKMKDRCYRQNNPGFKYYGARGIAICDEWRTNFHAFKEWASMNGYQRGLSIERTNNNGPYSPDNCIWTTHIKQCRNRRSNVLVTAFGETKCLKEWAEDSRCCVSYVNLYKRIKRGLPPERAFVLPTINRHRITAFGETKSIAEWTRDPRCRVNCMTLSARIRSYGFTPEAAITSPLFVRSAHAQSVIPGDAPPSNGFGM